MVYRLKRCELLNLVGRSGPERQGRFFCPIYRRYEQTLLLFLSVHLYKPGRDDTSGDATKLWYFVSYLIKLCPTSLWVSMYSEYVLCTLSGCATFANCSMSGCVI